MTLLSLDESESTSLHIWCESINNIGSEGLEIEGPMHFGKLVNESITQHILPLLHLRGWDASVSLRLFNCVLTKVH